MGFDEIGHGVGEEDVKSERLSAEQHGMASVQYIQYIQYIT